MRGKRKDLGGRASPTLHEGDYGQVEGIWWVYTPAGEMIVLRHVTEHENGTISVEFEHRGKKYRINCGVWEPPAQP